MHRSDASYAVFGGNCFKYIYRAGQKGSQIEDLEKAVWYAEQANNLEEIVRLLVRSKITKIASYHNDYIKNAMHAMRFGAWRDVDRWLTFEIQRLKGEECNNG